MTQPKTVKVTELKIKSDYGLPNTAIPCVMVEYDPKSKVVYIINPKYVPGSEPTSPYLVSAPYIALTELDYNVVKWTKA